MALKRPLSFGGPAKRMRMTEGPIPSLEPIPIFDEERDFAFGSYIDLTADDSITLPSSPCEATSPQPFRFMDLPAELRVSVYRCLLPNGLRIKFHPGSVDHFKQRSLPNFVNGWIWRASAQFQDGTQYPISQGKAMPKSETNIFLVNKFVSNEARAVLYGENTYVFSIDDFSHMPVSLQSPEIFAIFGTNVRLPLLRNFRSIEMIVEVRRDDHWAVKRHRARLEYFISVLKEHSDDEDQKSLLKYLKVRYERHYGRSYPARIRRSHMYGLESLAVLNGIEEVEVVGDELPSWYRRCLEFCISGKGGDVLPLEYPDIQVKKKIEGLSKRYKKTWQTTRAWYQPTLNWEEYAERNGIEVPKNVVIDLSGD